MRILCILLAAVAALSVPAQAGYTRRSVSSRQHSPAQGMLQSLRAMSQLLAGVNNRAAADAAAPRLLELSQVFHRQQAAAENAPPANLNRHLADMNLAMNDFRLACARLLQEKCYGSTQLGKAIRKTAGEF